MKPVLIIQNDAREGAGTLANCLAERGYDMDTYMGWDDTIAQLDPADYSGLGGRVYPGEQKEIGWHEIRLAPEAVADPLLRLHPSVAKAFHFHGDCFDTPPGCINLASSALTDAQLFRLGDRVYGFQFHPEMDTELVEVMCRQNTEYMAANGSNADDVIAESAEKLPAYHQRTRPMFEAWIDLLDAADKGGVA